MKTIEQQKAEIVHLFEQKKISMVVAFENYRGIVRPVFVKDIKDVEKISFDMSGKQNLATYLKRAEIKKQFPLAMVVRPTEKSSIALLIKENQLKVEDVLLIESMVSQDQIEWKKAQDIEIDRLWKMSFSERMDFWKKNFQNCIRCYACRQSCPHCYCQYCKADKNQPTWVERSAHLQGNFSWNFLRAFHQAGRCIECGACENACPANIPLMLLNRMQNKITAESFGESDPKKYLL